MIKKAELIEELKDLAKKHGHTPTTAELGGLRKKLRLTFGTLAKAMQEAGLTPREPGSNSSCNGVPRLTKKELSEIIRKKADDMGETPMSKDVPHLGAIMRIFGGWNKALIELGIPLRTRKGGGNKR
ncbi:MAG: hypothetical protein GY757_10085 [bacterium]|nr:hypothetical protein [bacterium]